MVSVGERNDQISLLGNERASYCNQATIRLRGQCADGALDLLGVAHAVGKHIDTERTACGLDQWQKACRTWSCRIVDDSGARYRRDNLLEELQPLRADSKLEERKSSDIAPRMREAGDKSSADRIGNLREYDRYGAGDTLQAFAYRKLAEKRGKDFGLKAPRD